LTLIVVSGAPGTGKSTIARAVGADLRFPVLSLDPVKEALADVLGLGDEDWSKGSEFCVLLPRGSRR
jgi:predicted kinase